MILLEPSTYPKRSPRKMMHWPRMVSSLYAHAEMNMQRYLLTEHYSTPAITFIRSLLDRISEPYFLQTEDPFDLYHQYVLPESFTISRIIDPFSGATKNKNQLVRGNETNEIVLPTFGIVGKTAPLEFDWDIWESVEPLKIMSHDSRELHLKFHNGQIEFIKDDPNYMIFALDIPALLWKYLTYIKHHNLRFQDVDLDLFISKFVLSYLYTQLVDVWVIKLISDCFDNMGLEDTDMFVSKDYFISSSRIKSSIKEMKEMIELLSSNRIDLGSFLNTDVLDDRTIIDCVESYGSIYAMQNSARNTGYELIKSISLLNLMVHAIGAQIESGTISKVIRDLEYVYKSISRSRWENHIHDESIKLHVSFLLIDIEGLLIDSQ